MAGHSRGGRLPTNKTEMGSANVSIRGGGAIQTGGTPSSLRGPRARPCATCDARIGESCHRLVGGQSGYQRWEKMKGYHRGR